MKGNVRGFKTSNLTIMNCWMINDFGDNQNEVTEISLDATEVLNYPFFLKTAKKIILGKHSLK